MIEPSDTIIAAKKSSVWVNEILQKRHLPNAIYQQVPGSAGTAGGSGGFRCSVTVTWDNNETVTVTGGSAPKLDKAKDLAATVLLRALGFDKYFLAKLKKVGGADWPKYVKAQENENEGFLHSFLQEAELPVAPLQVRTSLKNLNTDTDIEMNKLQLEDGEIETTETESDNDKEPEPKIPKIDDNGLGFTASDETFESKSGKQWLEEFISKINGKIMEPQYEQIGIGVNGLFKCTLNAVWKEKTYTASGFPQVRKKSAQHSASFVLLAQFGFNKSNLKSINDKEFQYGVEAEEVELEPAKEVDMFALLSQFNKYEEKVQEELEVSNTKTQCTLPKHQCYEKVLHIHHWIGTSLVGPTLNQIANDPSIVKRANVKWYLDQIIADQHQHHQDSSGAAAVPLPVLNYKTNSPSFPGVCFLTLAYPQKPIANQTVMAGGSTATYAEESAAIKMLELLLEFTGFQVEGELLMDGEAEGERKMQ